MKVLSRLNSAFQYWGTRAMIRFILAIPYPAALTLWQVHRCDHLGLHAHARRIVKIQMSSAFGMGMENLRRLVLKVFMNQGVILVDMVRYAFLSDDQIRKKIVVEGKEHLDEARATGRGLMLITGTSATGRSSRHLSRLLGIEFCVMADVRKDARLESVVDGIRARSGATILPPKGKGPHAHPGAREAGPSAWWWTSGASSRTTSCARSSGCPPFSEPGSCRSSLIKGNALVLPVYAVKKRPDLPHPVFPGPWMPQDFGDGKRAIQTLERLHAVLGGIRGREKYPDQWFWLHSRWVRRRHFQKTIKTVDDFQRFVLFSGRACRRGRMIIFGTRHGVN